MEKLTNTQLILLALLVSFVTSIATGITTITLMQQAPPSVTQPITRIVQKTIERIVPGEAKEVIKIETIIIKEEDLIVEAIDQNKNNLVVISGVSDEEGVGEQILGRGFVVSADGFIVTDSAIVSETGDYSIVFRNEVLSIEFITSDEGGFSLLKIIAPEEGLAPLSSAILIGREGLRVGQNVIAIYGPPIGVSTGIISGFLESVVPPEDEEDEEITILDRIMITVSLSALQSGSIVINRDGEMIGLAVVRDGETSVIPSRTILGAIQAVIAGVQDIPEEITEE